MHTVEISLSGFRAAIFDMDGTMVDNMAYHKKAWVEYLRRHGITFTDEEFRQKISGKKNDEIFRVVFGRELTPDELKEYAEEKESIYRELYAHDIKEVPGLIKTIEELHGHHIRTAIATTAPAGNRDFAIKALGLEGKFDVILGDEHVENGKPHPEIYLKAAEALGISPSECLVFEDSPPGVESGKRAGMTVVGLLTSHKPEDLRDADYLVPDFTHLKLVA